MNAIATETLGARVPAAGDRALRVCFLLLAVRRTAAGYPREDARDRAARCVRDVEALRRGEPASSWRARGSCPVILRNGTVYGWSPRMRFDLVVNTFVKDALLGGALKLHGGGWMWRPLVDIQDCADAMIACYEAPGHKVSGEIFNVVHSNYQIRELAMIVAGSVQLSSRRVTLEEVPGLKSSPQLRVHERETVDDSGVYPASIGPRGSDGHALAIRP